MFVGRSSDYAQQLKQRNKNAKGVSQWEEFFLKPLQRQYESALNQASTSFDYDISGAYSAFKRSQMQLEMSNLWSGQKQEMGSYLENTYRSSFDQALNKKLIEFSNAGEGFSGALSAEEDKLLKIGQQYSKVERAAYDYVRDVMGEDFDPTNIDQMSKFYNVNSDGVMTLNEEGVDFWDRILNSTPTFIDPQTGESISGQSFQSYLYETNQSLYDFYQENISNVREMVGGLKGDDFEYSQEERRNRLDADALEQQIDTSKVVGTIREDFTNDSERLAYLQNLEKILGVVNRYIETPQVELSRNGSASLNIDGVRYSTDTKYAPIRMITTSKDYKTMHIDSKKRFFNVGDVFTEDGKTYWYVTDNRTATRLYKVGG